MEKTYISNKQSDSSEGKNLTAVTIGKFDGFHLGHQLLIDRLKKFKDNGMRAAAVMIESGNPGLLLIEESKEICKRFGLDELLSLSFTDELRMMEPEDFVREILVGRFHAGAVVVGTDFRFGYQRKGSIEDLERFSKKYGFHFEAVSKLTVNDEIVSSTLIRDSLKEGNIELVNQLLGYTYSIKGIVEHGKHLGTTIGFPTINQIPDKMKLLPKFGVYKTSVVVNGKSYVGVTNVGVRPTIEDGDNVSVETYLLDFSEDIYGEMAEVEFQTFIRAEKKFDSLDKLITQLNDDIASVKALC